MLPAMSETGKKRRWVRWLRDAAIVLAIFAGVQWWQGRDLPTGPAPSLAGQLLNGELVALDDYRGKPVLVHFWATWCPICKLEQGTIDSLARSHKVIAVATTSGDAAEIRAYMEEQGLRFPVLLDESGDLGRLWGVRGVPTSYVVDGRGRIRSATVGYTTGLGLRWRLWRAG